MKETKIENKINELCNLATEYASSFNKTLNYSVESITDLEDILDFYSKDLNGNILNKIIRRVKKSGPTENQINSMAHIWGAYLGEVIIRNSDCKIIWCNENVFGDGEIIHLIQDETRLFPIDKVYKRLINGKEDNVVFFYEIAVGSL
ncbi:hypothetical protein [Gottfriedia solisilvae]|uniref:DUF3806 domain-containing protein n=1 Tax=Gottfriedia solisilvae TaxID=1516104 RepID=A0A8J3AK77_9BACI|nr:hypothetical protein [Gottfriedia solisilvae]GGI11534.1 hypothetical protein GCM10007380_08320 [Gottfriedia solisilvae]